MFICNCNGIRCHEVHSAISSGAIRPSEIFAAQNCSAQCAKCVCDMVDMIRQCKAADQKTS
jgi:bacterioferritin-associated ferredoxin